MEILPSKAAEKDSFSFGLEDGESSTWVETLQVLGCFLDGTGSTETLAKGRLLQGRKMFNKMRPFLCCPQIPLEERIQGFCSTVGALVLWGAGCWVPSLRVQQLVSVQENRWLRCVLGGRKELNMEWVAWLRKTKRATHNFRCRMWHRALTAIHGWAGHLARNKGPHRAPVVSWRNAEWWELMKAAGATSTDQSWRHPRNNWVRGFESALVRKCGAGWKDLANADRHLWMGQRPAFVAEAVHIWGGPRLVGSALYVVHCR